MDLQSAVFLGCFVFGFASVLISFLSGALHGGLGHHLGGEHLHLPGHLHGGHAPAGGHAPHGGLGTAHGHLGGAHGHPGLHHAGAHHAAAPAATQAPEAAGAAWQSWLPLNPMGLLTFVTWFGGAGFILHHYVGAAAWLSLTAAGLLGLGGAILVTQFLLRVVLPYQTEMAEGENDPVGSVGRISSPIRAGGVGEVVYVRGGTRRALGARTVDGRALERGTEVVIASMDRGIALVESWQEFLSHDRQDAVEKSE